jgi:hypothetical protein
MSAQHAEGWNRREFLGGVTVAGAVGLLGLPSQRVAAEPPPETTTLRLTSTPAICLAPQCPSTWLESSCGVRGSPSAAPA